MKTRLSIGLRLLAVFALALGGAFIFIRPVGATTIVDGGEIAAGETIDDDAVVTGEKVVVAGTVNGILFAFGDTITINGVINGDVIAMGSQVIIGEEAQVNGNLFMGCQSARIAGQISGSVLGGMTWMVLGDTAQVDRNLYFGGYSLEIGSGAVVGRDASAGAYQLILAGDIERDLNLNAGAFEMTGAIGGDARLEIGEPQPAGMVPSFGMPEDMPKAIAPGLRIAPEAVIAGRLTYTSPVDQGSAIQSQPAGGVTYNESISDHTTVSPQQAARPPLLNWLWRFLKNLFQLLVVGALAVWLIPTWLQRSSLQAQKKPFQSALAGLLAIPAVYIAALVVAGLIILVAIILGILTLGGVSNLVTGVGFSLLVIGVTAFSFLVSLGSKIVVAFLLGRLLMERAFPNMAHRQWWAMGLGVLIYALIASIPILGGIIAVLVTLVGVGSVWFLYRSLVEGDQDETLAA
jgi:cytoskeletal protein CcmA (bactofilin family)